MSQVVPLTRTALRRKATRSQPRLSGQEIARRINAEPAGLDIDTDSIVRLLEDSAAANDSNDQPIVSSGASELALRQLTQKYGFERLPLTLGELQGLLQYANILEYATGEALAPGPDKLQWQQTALKVYSEGFSAPWAPAVKLYLDGDMAGLRAYHRDGDWLTRLGREYRSFDE